MKDETFTLKAGDRVSLYSIDVIGAHACFAVKINDEPLRYVDDATAKRIAAVIDRADASAQR